MITEAQIETLVQEHPERRFLVHDGFCGWSYGSPLNPTFVTAEVAREILNIVAQVSSAKLLEEVQKEDPPLQFAEKGSGLYKRTGKNRFIAFLDPSVCMYDENYREVELDELPPG